MKLPNDFISEIEGYNAPIFSGLFESLSNTLPSVSVRFNRHKNGELNIDSPIKWCEYGKYLNERVPFTFDPAMHQGLYYVQDASSMFISHIIRQLTKEEPIRYLDACAAPGGKTTAAIDALPPGSLVVANEYVPNRAMVLSENLTKWGYSSVVVSKGDTAKYRKLKNFFDIVAADVPCSGEGMFRKNEDACTEWSLENVALCAKRQDEILDEAASMLRPGGRLVYSTCTFAPAENEGSISRFLERHSDFGIIPVEKKAGMSNGVPDWIENPAKDIEQTIRLWPHKLKGEGHYLAVLQKEGIHTDDRCGTISLQQPMKEKDCKECMEFLEQFVPKIQPKNLFAFGEQIYQMPEQMPDIAGLKVLRPGLHLGTRKKNRFEPAHALALALSKEDVRYSFDLSSESNEIRAYLNGQTLSHNGEKGWYLITVDGYSIGWGKLAGGIIKNHYPKGLRKNL